MIIHTHVHTWIDPVIVMGRKDMEVAEAGWVPVGMGCRAMTHVCVERSSQLVCPTRISNRLKKGNILKNLITCIKKYGSTS